MFKGLTSNCGSSLLAPSLCTLLNFKCTVWKKWRVGCSFAHVINILQCISGVSFSLVRKSPHHNMHCHFFPRCNFFYMSGGGERKWVRRIRLIGQPRELRREGCNIQRGRSVVTLGSMYRKRHHRAGKRGSLCTTEREERGLGRIKPSHAADVSGGGGGGGGGGTFFAQI